MISDGFTYLGVLLGLTAVIAYVSSRSRSRFFRYVPGFVLVYFGAAALNTAGLFADSDAIDTTGSAVQDALLPAMILLFLFRCDLRRIARLGPKLLLTYAVAALSIVAGFVVTYLLLGAALDPEAWKALGALAGSWTGGSANMVAIQGVLGAPEDIFGYVLITDTVLYSLWLLLMFSSVGFADRFDRWTRADTDYLAVDVDTADDERPADRTSLVVLIGLGLFASAMATALGGVLPELGDAINATTWTILIVSVLGLVVALTPLGRTPGSSDVAGVMLYVIIAIIASGSDFSSLAQAPLYLLAGAITLVVHLLLMVAYAKLTRTELFSIAVASTANVGGLASAPVVASAYSRQLVPVGVLFALLGAFLGTVLGLGTAQLLSVL